LKVKGKQKQTNSLKYSLFEPSEKKKPKVRKREIGLRSAKSITPQASP